MLCLALLWSWQLTSWNALHKQLTDVQKAQGFIQDSLRVIKDIFNHIDPSHPGHIMVTTVIAYVPYYTACHISAIKGGEVDIPVSDYRYFGDMEFCCKWQQNMRKVRLARNH